MKYCASLIILTAVMACNISNTLDRKVSDALRLAGDNRPQLELVLSHYADDQLKLEAARYLIGNMPGHYSYAHPDAVERFYDEADTMIAKLSDISATALRDSIQNFDRRYDRRTFDKIHDVKIISARFLIDNIDRAFDAWQHSPYCCHLDFDEFCEYILPYKSAELQAYDNWRERYSQMFADSLALTRSCSSFRNSSFRAAETFNNCLTDSFHPKSANISKPFLPYRLSTQLSIPFGTCDDFCQVAVPLFRAAGIPVMHDYVPRWGYAASAHGWLVVKAQTGKDIPFVPFYGTPKEQHKIDETKAKVYRHTYSADPFLQQLNASGEWVPVLFRNVFQRDVTAEYVKPHCITVNIDGMNGRYVYLAVSRHTDWDPIAVAQVNGGKASFTNLGAGCVYQPVVYDGTGKPAYTSAPFLLEPDGTTRYLEACTDSITQATLFRKSPLLEYAWDAAVVIDNCCFEASDSRDFSLFVEAGRVTTPPDQAGEIEIPDSIGRRRYWRFIKRDRKVRCYVAELAFFDRNTGERLYGEVYQYPVNTHRHAPLIRKYLFDNNMLQGFYVDGEEEAWVAVDFGKPVDISRIQYTPRADGNTIEPGDEYELLYWDNDNWTSLGRKVATTMNIDYDNIPTDALLLLRDLTKGHEERIFTLTPAGHQLFR